MSVLSVLEHSPYTGLVFIFSINYQPFLLLKKTRHWSHWYSGVGFNGGITWSLYLWRYQWVRLCSISPHILHSTLPSFLIMYSKRSVLTLEVFAFCSCSLLSLVSGWIVPVFGASVTELTLGASCDSATVSWISSPVSLCSYSSVCVSFDRTSRVITGTVLPSPSSSYVYWKSETSGRINV